jgi:hypothetical protein
MEYLDDFSSIDSLDEIEELEESENYVDIYKGKYYAKPKFKRVQKAIVFDLDETLGSFTDLDILWRAIHSYKYNITIPQFNDLLDLYPEFLRYGILPILAYLIKKRSSLIQCYIYTNNQCSHPTWINLITKYFDYKLLVNDSLFKGVVSAFKINNEIIEPARTSNRKIYSDFIQCTLLPTNTEICFVDNTYYSGMDVERVYYIQPRAYYHHLSTKQIVDRYIATFDNNNMPLSKYLIDVFSIQGRLSFYDPTFKELETDIYVAQRLMYHIKEFIFLTQLRKSRSKKSKVKMGRVTRKKWFVN